MTEQEKREKVIKGLGETLRYCHEMYNGCNNDGQYKLACMNQAAKDALALLKAQEPMKPITSEEQYGDHLRHCPSCGKVLPNSGEYGKSHYCYKCGQAVKW